MKMLAAGAVCAAGILVANSAQAQTVRVHFSVPEEITTVEMSNSLDAVLTQHANPGDFVDLTPRVTPENVLLNGGKVDLFQASVADGAEGLSRPVSVWIGSRTPQ